MATADFHAAAHHAQLVDTFDTLVQVGRIAMQHGNACAHVVSYDLQQLVKHALAEQQALSGTRS